jgi:ribosomal protein S18 acetylase RimI-like enzyme
VKTYEQIQAEIRKLKRERWAKILASEPPGHAPGRRPRDPDQERLLLRLDRARLARRASAGDIRTRRRAVDELRTRPATPADEEFLRALNRQAYEDVVTRQFGEWNDAAERDKFDDKWQRAAFRVIEMGGTRVGVVWSTDQVDHVRLHELQLLPEYQGRRIGSRVLIQETDRAERASKPVRLRVLRTSRALEFYRRHGFAETGRDASHIELERGMDSAGPGAGEEDST